MSSLTPQSGQKLTSATAADDSLRSLPEKTITLSVEKYEKLLRQYHKKLSAMRRCCLDAARDADLLLADVNVQLNDLAKLK